MFRATGELGLSSFIILAAAVVLTGCLSGEDPDRNGGLETVLSDGDYTPEVPDLPSGWPALRWPSDNPFTPAKAILGRRLFFEINLSSDGTVSCTWCHAAGHAFTDKHRVDFSTGVGGVFTSRNSPTTVNMGFATTFMFDGSESSLEEQALRPLLSPHEMNMTIPLIESRLTADTMYVRLFRQAFGPGRVTIDNVARALATYQRTLVSFRTPYDAWAAGDTTALSETARRGARIFLGEKGGCARCHVPPLFTDGQFHNVGLDGIPRDSGRAIVTKFAPDIGKFKTPTLRNISQTGPYMHDGRISSLEHVIMHYNEGPAGVGGADSLLRPLGLNEFEIYELVTFLEALTDEAIMLAPQL